MDGWKYSHSNRQKLPSSTTSRSLNGPAQGNTPRISAYTLFPETSHCRTFLLLIVWVYIFIQICAVGSKNASFLQQSAYRPFKVDNFGTNRQSVCDVLLVLHCDYGAISCIVSEMRRLLAKIAYFSYSSLIRRSRSTCFLSNFALKLTMT